MHLPMDPVVSRQNTTSTRRRPATHPGRRPLDCTATIRQHDTTGPGPAASAPPPPPASPPPAAAAAGAAPAPAARQVRTAAAHASGSWKSLQTTASRPASAPPGPSVASIPS
jgi:hypothetical protein